MPIRWSRFLLGLPANTVSYVNRFRPPMDVYNWETGFFVQDDFKVTPKLTLNLGLRYEIITPFTENNDLLVNFDPTYVAFERQEGPVCRAVAAYVCRSLDPRYIGYGVVTADQLGLPRSLVKADLNNLAPRVGIAWRITG